MTEPLKISVKGSSLSCGEYDENLDRVLDRANHTGLQSCETISDLEECITDLAIILDILRRLGLAENSLDAIGLRLDELTDVESDLAKLKNDLLILINALRADVDTIFLSITNIRQLIDSLAGQLDAIQAQIEALANGTNVSLADIYRRLAQIDSKLLQQTGQINTLFSSITSETTNRINADNNLLSLINREVGDRINSDSNLQNNLNSEVGTRANADSELLGQINIERAGRESGDNYLVTLLNDKAPKSGPVFSGGQANFTTGAITVTPLPTALKEVINGEWYRTAINIDLSEIYRLIATKADHTNTQLYGQTTTNGLLVALGGVIVEGDAFFFNGIDVRGRAKLTTASVYTAAVDAADQFVTNVEWVTRAIRNAIAGQGAVDLSSYARLDGATFTGGIIVNQSVDVKQNLLVYGVAQFFDNPASFHAGIKVPSPAADSNGVEVPNTNWVNNKIGSISNVIKAAISFNADSGAVAFASNIVSLNIGNGRYIIVLNFNPVKAVFVGSTPSNSYTEPVGNGDPAYQDYISFARLIVSGNTVEYIDPPDANNGATRATQTPTIFIF